MVPGRNMEPVHPRDQWGRGVVVLPRRAVVSAYESVGPRDDDPVLALRWASGLVKRWTPSDGASALLEEFGADAALACLASLLSGEVGPAEFHHEPWSTVLSYIGNYRSAGASIVVDGGSPLDLTKDGNAYWARSWAARALAYIGDERSTAPLVAALRDVHWRVRMTAAQTIGRLRLRCLADELLPLLDDEHARVSEAAALAIERTT